MNIVVTKGSKSLEISFRQKLDLAPACRRDEANKLYEAQVTATASLGRPPLHWILACPAKDGHPGDRLYKGEEVNLFRLDRQGRINPDDKIRVKLV